MKCSATIASSTLLKLSALNLAPGTNCAFSATLKNTGGYPATLADVIVTSTTCSSFGYTDNIHLVLPQPIISGGGSFLYDSSISLLSSAPTSCEGATATFDITITGTESIPPLTAPTIAVSPTTIDSGQSSTLFTTHSFSGGVSPYACQWLAEAPGSSSYGKLGGSFSCTSGGLPSTSTGPLTATGTWHFELEVTDSIGNTVTSNAVSVLVNACFRPPVICVSPSTINSGQSASLSTSTSFSGGTSPYMCQWLEERPGSSSYSKLGAAFSCTVGSKPGTSTGALGTTGVWHFELQVTDSSVTVTSNAVSVTVKSCG